MEWPPRRADDAAAAPNMGRVGEEGVRIVQGIAERAETRLDSRRAALIVIYVRVLAQLLRCGSIGHRCVMVDGRDCVLQKTLSALKYTRHTI